MKFLLSALFLSIAATAAAQSVGIDRLTPPLPTAAERKAADIASWATVGAAVYLDLHETIGKCRGQDDCYRAVGLAGVRYGVVLGGSQLLKVLFHRERPCAPTGSCGIDNPDRSFPSGHTAFAFAGVTGPRVEFSLPLAIGTGGLRVAAGKHWLTDVLGGAALGTAASLIR